MTYALATRLTPIQITRAGILPAAAASLTAIDATNGNKASMGDGHAFLRAYNGGGSPSVVTIDTPATPSGLALGDVTVSIPAGEERWIYLGMGAAFDVVNQGGGDVFFTFNPTASVKVGVYHLQQP